jgi:hypothetical protein
MRLFAKEEWNEAVKAEEISTCALVSVVEWVFA